MNLKVRQNKSKMMIQMEKTTKPLHLNYLHCPQIHPVMNLFKGLLVYNHFTETIFPKIKETFHMIYDS